MNADTMQQDANTMDPAVQLDWGASLKRGQIEGTCPVWPSPREAMARSCELGHDTLLERGINTGTPAGQFLTTCSAAAV